MNLYQYTLTSLQIFILYFLLGSFIDKHFEQLQIKYKLNPLISGFSQLLTIIIVTYFIFKYHKYTKLFENYSPNLIFSSFLFGLQPNMIKNFKQIIL
jgi:hypothetical protein